MKKIALLAAMHGNETYGFELFDSFVKLYPELQSQVKLVIGNIEAFKRKIRFIDNDMNRSYAKDAIGHEKSEILRTEKILTEFNPDFIIDIHTTKRDSGIFFLSNGLSKAKNKICEQIGYDVVVLNHDFTRHSFIGNHDNAISLEYSLSMISGNTTLSFCNNLASLIKGETKWTPKQKVYNFLREISKVEYEHYSGLANYENKTEGVAIMVPKDKSEMDAEYYGFWCKET